MKLRWQLALVSLVTLVLPWVLFEYLKVFNGLLQESQIRALETTASAVATRLGNDATPKLQGAHHGDDSLYAHRLAAPPIIDGYMDDWHNYDLAPRRFDSGDNFALSVRAGLYNNRLSVLMEVADPHHQPHQPGGTALATGDHVVIATGHRYLVLRTGTPGPAIALYRSLTGEVYRDYRLQAAVQHMAGGYRLEFQLPLELARDNFAIAAVDNSDSTPRHLGTLGALALHVGGDDPGVLPPPDTGLVTADLQLQTVLETFTQPGLAFTLVDTHRWQLAHTPRRQSPTDHALDRWIARLGQRQLPPYEPPMGGRYQGPGVSAALAGQPHRQWFNHPRGPLAVVAVPIYRSGSATVEDRLAGALVAEQQMPPWRHLHSRALARLLLVTVAAALLLLLVLIGYASWLSWRIGRLSRAAMHARLDPKPEALLAHWPSSRIGDELSELSTSYRDLLQQLRGYTDYLKSLSGKLSHELRTPLAVVRTSLDNLANCELDSESQTYTRRAREGTERLSDILSAMTEATRVEASIQQAEKENIHLASLLVDIARAYSETYDRPVRLITENAEADYWHTRVAPELIVQMLDKLVDNAQDFATPGTPIDLILTHLPHTDIPGCRLEVSNTGPLLPPGREGQIFDSLTSQREDGEGGDRVHMGLGLFIVSLITQYHGGSVSAHNRRDNTGVIVEIRLPLPPPAVFAPRRS